MKKILFLIALAHLPVLGMDEVHPPSYDEANAPAFNLASFLEMHNWQKRKDALTDDQREELAEYLDGKREGLSSPIDDKQLGTVVIDGLDEVEREKNPEELQEMLHKGIIKNSAKLIARAGRLGANINTGKNGKPPILWAVLLKRSNAVEQLLQYNNINLDVKHFNKALIWHTGWRTKTQYNSPDYKSTLLLLKKGAPLPDHPADQDNIVITAILGNEFNIIQEMIIRGFDISNMNHNVWHELIRNPNALIFFISKGANPNQTFGTVSSDRPLNMAISLENIDSVRILLDAGADINYHKRLDNNHAPQTPLDQAIGSCKQDKRDIIELLVERGALIS